MFSLWHLLLYGFVSSILANEDFFEKYTYAKTMSRCLGEEPYLRFLSQVRQAKRNCNSLDYRDLDRMWGNFSSNSLLTFLESFRSNPFGNRPQNFNNNNNPNNNFNNILNLDDMLGFFPNNRRRNSKLIVNPNERGRPFPISNNNQNNNNNKFGTNPDSGFIIVADDPIRSTARPVQESFSFYPNDGFGFPQDNIPRQPDSRFYAFDSEFLSEAMQNIRNAVLNFTCVLQSLDMIDSNYNINYRTVINTFIEQNILDYRLRQDLSDGVNFCRESIRCTPVLSIPIPVELHRLLEFMKCEKRTRLTACFRHDLRQNLQLFDLSALPGHKGRRAYLENLMAVLMGTDLLAGSELF